MESLTSVRGGSNMSTMQTYKRHIVHQYKARPKQDWIWKVLSKKSEAEMNFYFILFVVLGTSLPREVSSQESCSVPGDKDFESRSEHCGYDYEIDRSTCHDLRYDQYGNLLPPSSKDPRPGNYILFVFLDSLSVLILVPLILFFNINLASGTGHSIVFSTQVLLAFFSIQSVAFGSRGYGSIGLQAMMVSGLLVFFNTPLMMFSYPLTLAHIALGYVKVVLAVVIVVVYLGVATASQCPVQCCRGCWARLRRGMRHWREAHLAQRPLFTGACSVAILIYGSLLDVSFRLIFTGYSVHSVCIERSYGCNNLTTCYYQYYSVSNPAICWGSSNHLPYLIPGSVIVILALLPVLLFFYHPGVPALVSFITKGRLQLPRLHKIKPVLDIFQGVYKPKMQFFAGLHLLYRVVLWCVVAFSLDWMYFGISITQSSTEQRQFFLVVWLLILGIQGLFMPFESRRHNYLESLIMISVSLIASTGTVALFLGVLVIYVFSNLPLFCVIVYYIYKLVRFCCCRRRQNRYQDIPEVQEDIEESFQGERWQPPDQALMN